jgi:hypothetical protein
MEGTLPPAGTPDLTLQGFDHVIALFADVEKAAAGFTALGFHVVERADAARTETANRYVTFADGSYLQLSAFYDRAQSARHKWAPLLDTGDGWVDYALRSSNVVADAARLTDGKLTIAGPKLSVRPLTNGAAWEANILHAGRGAAASPLLPYFIEDRNDRQLRVPSPPGPQPKGATGVSAVTLLTGSIEPHLAGLITAFGPARDIASRLPGSGRAAAFDIAGRTIEIVEAASGDLDEAHRTRGDGVYEILLAADLSAPPGSGDLLPLELTHGARIRLHGTPDKD